MCTHVALAPHVAPRDACTCASWATFCFDFLLLFSGFSALLVPIKRDLIACIITICTWVDLSGAINTTGTREDYKRSPSHFILCTLKTNYICSSLSHSIKFHSSSVRILSSQQLFRLSKGLFFCPTTDAEDSGRAFTATGWQPSLRLDKGGLLSPRVVASQLHSPGQLFFIWIIYFHSCLLGLL